MLNNKGQSLVLFILIIPILLGIMTLVLDVGNVLIQKNEMDNQIEFILDYGLTNKIEQIEQETVSEEAKNELSEDEKKDTLSEEKTTELEKLKTLLDYNQKNSQNKVIAQEDSIIISSKSYVKGIFATFFGFNGFEIESEYRGYLDGNIKKIEKIK
ncbi:MAG: hypothetical protein MR598_02475 [Erysipelotrichaceae bacterium]|nr:hypothetical protein [Erysipelotrichaceae bacterium]